MNEQTTNIELDNQGTDQKTPVNGGKTFTQEQVNQIITERLSREKSKSEALVLQREQELQRKEFMFEAKQTLTEKGLSPDLLGALNTSSPEAFNSSLAILEEQLNKTKQEAFQPPPMYAAGTGSNTIIGNASPDTSVREAMGLNRK